MKKIILTSLVLASTAAFADMADPLFMPKAGKLVATSAFDYTRADDEEVNGYSINETLTYGVNDRFAITSKIALTKWDVSGADWALGTPEVSGKYRFNLGGATLDVTAGVANTMIPGYSSFLGDESHITLGALVGKDFGSITATGFLTYEYSFNKEHMNLILGSKNQFRLNNQVSLNLDAAIGWFDLSEERGDADLFWNVTVGANYSFNANNMGTIYAGYGSTDETDESFILAGIKYAAQF